MEVDVVESVAHGVCFVNVVFNLMIVQFHDDCSVRVCVALVIVVNGGEVV